jgi:hypothetical protein
MLQTDVAQFIRLCQIGDGATIDLLYLPVSRMIEIFYPGIRFY